MVRTLVAVPCVVAVAVWGELSTGALVAVLTAGAVVVGLALARRSGEAAPRVGWRAVGWLACLVVVLAWELVALSSDTVPTYSDLADPVLAVPPARGAATLGWLAGGGWLLARPGGGAGIRAGAGSATAGRTVAAAMRTTPGRVAVLVSWLWLGVHFLAR
jgi:hypothetical protein